MPVQWKSLKRGVWLIDEWLQRCVVVRKAGGVLVTRRFDRDGYWDTVATWDRESFAQREWRKIRPPTKKPQPRMRLRVEL